MKKLRPMKFIDDASEVFIGQRTVQFHPERSGVRKMLGDLEAAVMETLWATGSGTVRQVRKHLEEDRPLAYTTVMTVMSRLANKGLLIREKQGSAFVYRPNTTRKGFMESTVRTILVGLLEETSLPTIDQFVESVAEMRPEQMEKLIRRVDECKKP